MRARWVLSSGLGIAGCLSLPPAVSTPPDDPAPSREIAQGAEVWPGRAVDELYRVGEVRQFVLRQGGHEVGRSWGRYVGPDAGGEEHRFETRIELDVPGRGTLRSAGRLVLDARGRVVSGHERSDVVELTFERVGSNLVFTDGMRTDEVAYAPDERPTVAMAHSAILHEELMLALEPLVAGPQTRRLVSLSGGLPVEWEGVVQTVGDVLRIDTSLGEQISFRDGRLTRVQVEASDLEIEAEDAPMWPAWDVAPPVRARYEAPTDRVELREVELPGRPGEPVLWGELVLPKDAERPVPAVLYLSSSGQEDRHGFAGPPLVDLGSHEITDALALGGFAVLRLDDRGHGRSASGPVSFVGQIEDARRGLRTLLVQEEVDPDRVLLVGHGEGGLRALHLAGDAGIAGVALLGVPGRPYRDVLVGQSSATLADAPPEVRKTAAEQQRRMLETIEAGGEVPTELEEQAQWLREILLEDPVALVAQVRAPIWIAQGDKDFEVDPSVDPKRLADAATQGAQGGRAPPVRHYPELDHLFRVEPGTSTPARYLRDDRPVDPAFLADLVAWARGVVGPAYSPNPSRNN